MSEQTFNMICNGIFNSLTIYCLQVFGNVWGIDTNDENNRRYTSFTKDDCKKMQILQNKVLRLKTNLAYDTPTTELIKQSGDLSIHQLTAYHTILTVFKTIKTGKPYYLSKKLELNLPKNESTFPHRQAYSITVHRNLTISRGGMMYRGAKLWNQLPIDLRKIEKLPSFKSGVKKWVMNSISIKPP